MLNINGKPIMRSSNSVESSLRQKFTGEIVILCKDVCIDGEEMKFYIKVLSWSTVIVNSPTINYISLIFKWKKRTYRSSDATSVFSYGLSDPTVSLLLSALSV